MVGGLLEEEGKGKRETFHHEILLKNIKAKLIKAASFAGMKKILLRMLMSSTLSDRQHTTDMQNKLHYK